MASPAGADVSFQYAGLSLFGPSRLERRSKRLQGAVPEGLAVAEAEGQRVGQDDAVAVVSTPSKLPARTGTACTSRPEKEGRLPSTA